MDRDFESRRERAVMEGTPHPGRNPSTSWQISTYMTGGTLAMPTRRGPRQIGDIDSLSGSFYLHPEGRLTGFSIQLGLSELRGVNPQCDQLRWDAMELRHSSCQDFTGRCILAMGGHEVTSCTFGKIVRLGSPAFENSYFRITLTTDFHGTSLHWPHTPWRRFHQMEVRFFTEIHQPWRLH